MEMKIVGFVEGARRNGPGIVSVPTILRSVAAQGHHIVLAMGGPPSLGCEKYLVPDVDSGASRTEGKGTFGILRLNAWSDWSLCPAMFWRFNRLVREADFVLLHSLYSFPKAVRILAPWSASALPAPDQRPQEESVQSAICKSDNREGLSDLLQCKRRA